MSKLTILYDEPQEAVWFHLLHQELDGVADEAITAVQNKPHLQKIFAYDRPDIVLLDDLNPILMIEQTVEVPSGHNVGQRFARIAAAAECGVPSLYFFPYVAKKHGGKTAGPRYVNARLFHAIDAMIRTTKTAITTINWPIDGKYEVSRDPKKNDTVKEYIATFFDAYHSHGMVGINSALLTSDVHRRMVAERDAFVANSIKNPRQYDQPPPSVSIITTDIFIRQYGRAANNLVRDKSEVVLYNVGMRNIRSDPYTGMAMLYKYLYIARHPMRLLILWFPEISIAKWRVAAKRGNRKDIRLFKVVADAIIFSDGFLSKLDL